MGNYEKTKDDYNVGVKWHSEKTFSYDWSKQINKFCEILKGKKVTIPTIIKSTESRSTFLK